jgi:hypothetical protein
MPDLTLQAVLGTDKNNQCFSVFKSTTDPAKLEVYFGMALLEKVNNDGSSLLFKMLVGRLYNSRIKVKTLEEAFGLHRSTFRQWGEVLNSGDDDKIIRVLSSSSGTKKITPEIDRFIRVEFQHIYPKNSYSYSSVIRKEIKKVFKIELTGESLRHIFNEEKDLISKSSALTIGDCCNLVSEHKVEDQENEFNNSGTEAEPPPTTCFQSDREHTNESLFSSNKYDIYERLDDTKVGVSDCETENNTSSKTDDNRKYTLPFRNLDGGQKQFFHHAGLLLLLPSILKFSNHVDQKILLQWISTVLLGAKNIEQTVSLDLNSLAAFLDQRVIRSLKQQRVCLKTICTPEAIQAVLKANIEYCGPSEHNIFYYDPHSMPYTGLKKILKGWCGSLGKATKVNYHDFIHNFKGEPIWFESFDNYLDLRDRFTGVLSNFSEAIGLRPEQMTTIVDRGIYGKGRMEAIHEAGFGLVTWQKNYTDKFWDESKELTRFSILRCRNNSRDIKRWQIEFYRDGLWDTVKGYHRIIVKILAPGKKTVAQLSILSNGKCTDQRATYAMLNRWIQENDFAYLIKHFGINMITTYDSELYADLNEEFVEKEVYSDAYIIIKKAVVSIEGKIKTILLRRETKEASRRALSKKDGEQLEGLKGQLAELKEELTAVGEKEDKYTKLAERGTRRLKLNPKILMDALKISARNIFYSHVEVFREHFDNYRNDHKIFRELTRAPGYVSRCNGFISVELNLARNFEPKELLLIQSFLNKISLQNDPLRVYWKIS